MMTLKNIHAVSLLGGLLIAGCTTPTAPAKDYLLLCKHDTGSEGSYTLSPNQIRANGLAAVVPTEGGNLRGKVLIEACIEGYHKRAGTMPKSKGKSDPVMMAGGKLSVPQGYNLSVDERTLWATLTLQQQKRALAFLKSGSTIQSSLLED